MTIGREKYSIDVEFDCLFFQNRNEGRRFPFPCKKVKKKMKKCGKLLPDYLKNKDVYVRIENGIMKWEDPAVRSLGSPEKVILYLDGGYIC